MSEGKIQHEGRLIDRLVLMLLLGTADACDYTDESCKDNEAVLPSGDNVASTVVYFVLSLLLAPL